VIDFAWALAADGDGLRVTVGVGGSALMPAQAGGFIVAYNTGTAGLPNAAIALANSFTGTVTYSENPDPALASHSDVIGVISIAAADTNAPLRCRIQPVGTLPNPTTLRILGKARLGTFEEDNDECLIAGMDKVLLEFGVADMWERERQFGFAQQPFARGAALLDQLKKVQVCQQAYNKRLIPSGGYRDEYGLNSGTVFP
jgi:hypothetical protein